MAEEFIPELTLEPNSPVSAPIPAPAVGATEPLAAAVQAAPAEAAAE